MTKYNLNKIKFVLIKKRIFIFWEKSAYKPVLQPENVRCSGHSLPSVTLKIHHSVPEISDDILLLVDRKCPGTEHGKDIFIGFWRFIIGEIKTVQCNNGSVKHFIFVHGTAQDIEGRVGYCRVFQKFGDIKAFFLLLIHRRIVVNIQKPKR